MSDAEMLDSIESTPKRQQGNSKETSNHQASRQRTESDLDKLSHSPQDTEVIFPVAHFQVTSQVCVDLRLSISYGFI